MSLSKGTQSSSTPLHDLYGSDGPASQSKSQAQYAEEVKVYLEAARAAFSQLTVSSLGALCSDPTLDFVYVGCMRELAGLGCGHGGKEAPVPRSIPMEAVENRQTIAPASLDKSLTLQSSIPGYACTIHFFPRETYTRCPRADRPSNQTLTRKVTKAMKKNPSTAHLQSPTNVSWTVNGDISVCIPPDAIGLADFLQQIPLMTIMKSSSSPSVPPPNWAGCRGQGDPTLFFLKLHRVPASWMPEGDFSRIRTLFQPGGSIGSNSLPQQTGDSDYVTFPKDFLITGRAAAIKQEEGEDSELRCDVFIDVSDLERRFVESVRKACRNRAQLKARYNGSSYYFSTSFIELKD